MSQIIKIVEFDYFYTVTFILIVIRDMKKQKILQFAVFSSVCLALACSNPLKPSTNLGEQIINDTDPNLIDINRNVKPFSGSLRDSAFSMRDINDTLVPGYQYNPPFLTAGRNVGPITEDVIAYLEFRPTNFRADNNVRNSLKTGIIDSVVLNLRRFRIKTLSSPTPGMAIIDVDTCPVLGRFPSLSIVGRKTDSIPFINDFLQNNVKNIGAVSINTDSLITDPTQGGDTALTVVLDSSYIARIKNAVKDTIGFSDTTAFGLCLAPRTGSQGLARFMNLNGDATSPNLLVYYHASATDTARRTQLFSRDHASNTVLETAPDSALACGSSFSSWETARRAVYKIDVSSLAAFMDTAGPIGKKYVVLQKADVRIPVSKSVSDMRLDSIYVHFMLLDSLANNFYDLGSSSYKTLGNFYIRDSISSDTSYVVSLANLLQPLLINKNRKSVYLYLWVAGQNSATSFGSCPSFIQVAWKPEQKLTLSAVVTNPR
jgi:hypothetical protein